MKNINSIKFYNRTALKRDGRKEFGPVKIMGKSGLKELIEEIQKKLKNGMKVIGIGCGTGDLLMEVYKTTDKKVKLIGIDNSSDMIKIAKRKSKGIRDISFYIMGALKTKFKDNTFNIAINRFGAPSKSFKETYRILRKNGLFFLFISDKKDWKEVRNIFGFEKPPSLKNRLRILKEAGFKILKIRKFSSTVYHRDLDSLAKILEIIPFKPLFNRKRHFKKLKQYEKKYKTYWGIKLSHERLLIICKK